MTQDLEQRINDLEVELKERISSLEGAQNTKKFLMDYTQNEKDITLGKQSNKMQRAGNKFQKIAIWLAISETLVLPIFFNASIKDLLDLVGQWLN